MDLNDEWLDEPTLDRLSIFVSSRLLECKAERSSAHRAVSSINHHPVLFEHVGARSIGARTVYLSRLRDSHIMVAIFKDGYGYIDEPNGMTISGLEDEFRTAVKLGIPILLYVHANSGDRDQRLAKLIQEAERTITVTRYADPSALERQIRENVTAEITRKFIGSSNIQDILRETPATILQRAEQRYGPLIKREQLLRDLGDALSEADIVVVYGPAGIGKTTLAANYAAESDAPFIRASKLPPRDLFDIATAALATTGESTVSHPTLAGARRAFSDAWAKQEAVRLIIDECDYVDEMIAAVQAGGGTSEEKKLIFTSRSPHRLYRGFEIPPLTADEVATLTHEAATPARTVDAVQAGNPLYVLRSINRTTEEILAEIPLLRELTAYMALSPVQLDADDVLDLIGDPDLSVHLLVDSVGKAATIIEDTSTGFRFTHENIGDEIKAEILRSPQRLRFVTKRLLELYEKGTDFRAAYIVSSNLADGSTQKYASAAVRQSIILGDIQLAREISEKQLEDALKEDRKSDAFQLMVNLVYPLDLLGATTAADKLLKDAEELAVELGDDAQELLAEIKISSSARRTLSARDVEILEQRRELYKESGDMFQAARLGVELSALYLAGKQYEKAIDVVREAKEVFEELGDEHGVDVAERNLVSALSDSTDSAGEMDALLKRIEARARDNSDQRRQRAWHCNLLTRRYRQNGRLDDALRTAEEAIQLSEELGEESLHALSHINLGNVYKDREEFANCLEAYKQAGKIAQHCMRRDVEADSSRLQAAVLNDFEEAAALVDNPLEEAKLLSQHAIGLLRDTINFESLAWSFLELADAEKKLSNYAEAAAAFFEAAAAFKRVPDELAVGIAIANGCRLIIQDDPEGYLKLLSGALSVELDSDAALGDQFISMLAPIISAVPTPRMLMVLGSHIREIHQKLPPLMRPVLLESLVEAIDETLKKDSPDDVASRCLMAGFVLPFLAQDSLRPHVYRKLADTITASVDGIDFRHTQGGDFIWTVALGEEHDITVSVVALDDAPATHMAVQSVAFFFKAFELDVIQLIDDADIDEVALYVSTFEEAPEDIRQMASDSLGLDKILDDQIVAVSRSVEFATSEPTFVFLRSDFLEHAASDDESAGALQFLLAATLRELLYRAFKGEVNIDEIHPKVLSIISQTDW